LAATTIRNDRRAESHAHPYSHTFRDADTQCYTNTDTYSKYNSESYTNTDTYFDSDPDIYAYALINTDSLRHSNAYSKTYPDPKVPAKSTPSPDTALSCACY
jgi:hypothetical protein